MFFKKLIALLLVVSCNSINFAQEKKQLFASENNGNIMMTWNKNTPESEMKDDILALKEQGITIKYSNIKRNSKNEITGLKVEYSDRKGNKGAMELDNQQPINTIQFFSQDGEVGFGQPSSGNGMFAGNDFFQNFGGDRNKNLFQFKLDNDSLSKGNFNFIMPDGKAFQNSRSKIIIQNSGKKPLVIEDGKVVEGGDDYTKEELDQIKNQNKIQQFNFGGTDLEFNNKEFDFRNQDGLDAFKNQMLKMQDEMNSLQPKNDSQLKELEDSKKEMLQIKEEMIKAKEELQKAKSEMKSSQKNIKSQKS